MKNDEEFGEHAAPRMYSYFEEVFKRTNVRGWLGWNDEAEGFTAEERRNEFYSWIIPGADGDAAKLPEAKSVRELSSIIEDDSAMKIFKSTDGTLSRALARFEIDHPEDWFPKITAATSAIKSLTPEKLRGMDESTLSSLIELKQKIDQALEDRLRLTDKKM